MNHLISIKSILAFLISVSLFNPSALAQIQPERTLTVQDVEEIGTYSLALNSNKAVVASSQSAWVVDLSTGDILLKFDGHLNDPNPPESSSRGITAVDISPDGQYVATGDRRATVFIWDIETGEIISTIRTPNADRDPRFVSGKEIFSVQFSPDGNYLATAQVPTGAEPIIGLQVWDIATREPIFETRISAKKIIFAEKHNFVITIGSGVKIYSLETSDILFEDVAGDIRLSPDKNHLWYTTGAGRRSVKLVHLDLRTLEVVDSSEPFDVRSSPKTLIHPNGKLVLVIDEEIRIGEMNKISTRIVNLKSNMTLSKFVRDGLTNFRNLQFTPEGKKLIGSHENKFFFWDISNLTSSVPGAKMLDNR